MNTIFEINIHDYNLISLKDTSGQVCLADKKWDNLFIELCEFSEVIYFKGERETFYSIEIENILKSYSNIESAGESLTILPKASILLNRNGLNDLWNHFEYSFLFFIHNSALNKNPFIKEFINDWDVQSVMNDIDKGFILYKSFELDVFWLMKSTNISFPNFIST